MISVAIDGPAGAGKSTIAKALSKDMGYIYVDTGALYRTVGLYMLRNNISTTDGDAVGKALNDIKVEMKHIEGIQRVFLNDEDVSDVIRTEEVSMAASNVSAIPSVRAFLLSLQRDIAKKNNIVMDGSDIATVVLPNATVKIFLTASAEERANRRYKELIEKGMDADYDKVLEDIKVRDYNDSHRDIAPLKPSEESVIIDTTDVPLNEAIAMLKKAVEEGIK